MNVENPHEEIVQLAEHLIVDIMCISQLYSDYHADVYVRELGDFPTYTRYTVRNFTYSQNFYRYCFGTNKLTGEIRPISLREINTDCMVVIHKELTSLLHKLPEPYVDYTFQAILGDVMFLKKGNQLYYLFTANGNCHFDKVKEGPILHTAPLATRQNYSIKFECNAVDGFCVFRRDKCLETFWCYRAALQYMYQFDNLENSELLPALTPSNPQSI